MLAEEGVRFTILAPSQLGPCARSRATTAGEDLAGERGEPIGAVGTDRPYRWCHPARPDLAVDLVVYDGDAGPAPSRSATRAPRTIVDAALDHAGDDGGMVAAATDGETFGHHHTGAERDARPRARRRGAGPRRRACPASSTSSTTRPPTHQAVVRTSAWSCAHGVGPLDDATAAATPAASPGWTQAWREPLRHALDRLRDWGVEVMDRRGAELLATRGWPATPTATCVVGARTCDDFAAAARRRRRRDEARTLLEAQRFALLMYTSCGWFFNDLAGIETVQILRYAARSMDLYRSSARSPRWTRPRRAGPGPLQRPRGRRRPPDLARAGVAALS